MPTKPEVAIMSPERMMAVASAALTTLLRIRRLAPGSAVALAEPADDALRFAGDEHVDVPARQAELGVGARAQLPVEGARGARRDHVVGLRVDVECRHRHLAQVDLAPGELPRVSDPLVPPGRGLGPVLRGLAR